MDTPRALRSSAEWKKVKKGRAIRREYRMKDFMAAVTLIRRIADRAEAMDHHPDIHLTGYRKLTIELTTHSAGGLTKKDHRLALAIERMPKKLKKA